MDKGGVAAPPLPKRPPSVVMRPKQGKSSDDHLVPVTELVIRDDLIVGAKIGSFITIN